MYYGETKNSPSLNSFEATLKKFIRETYNNFVNALYEQNETQYTKKFLRDEYFPSLDIVSLTRERSIEDFINQYGLLTRVEIDLLTPNQEIDNNDFFRQARLKKEEAQSKKMAIVHSNYKEGLSLGGITRQVNSALNQGNSKVNLSGKDRQGNKLEGTNESFKIKSQLSEPPLTFEGIVTRCYQSLENLIQEGSIIIPERADNISEKIKQIWNNRNNSNE